jgi:hypothetical protein
MKNVTTRYNFYVSQTITKATGNKENGSYENRNELDFKTIEN